MGLQPEFITKLKSAESEMFDLRCEQGRNPNAPHDRGHWSIKGTERPLSVSPLESRLLFNLVALSNPYNILEIGTGFGYSALWMAGALIERVNHAKVITIDDWSEGLRSDIHRLSAQTLWETVGVSDRIESLSGRSPDIFSRRKFPVIDFAFIDGEHRQGQPLIDYRAVSQLLSPTGMIVFHDVQEKYEVAEAVESARGDGFSIISVNSSCEPSIAYKISEHGVLIQSAIMLAERGFLAIQVAG